MLNKYLTLLLASLFVIILPLESWEGGWDHDVPYKQLEKFGEHLAKKYRMKYLNKGCGTCVDSRKVLFDLSLMCNYQWTIQQARPYVVAMMQEFWQKASCDSNMYREAHELNKYGVLPGGSYTIASLGLKIAFWDKDVNRPPQPYVSRIIVAEGEIRYYMANPKDQSLQPPQVETIDQAMKLLAAQNPQSIKPSQQ